jgi:hypothetical protein
MLFPTYIVVNRATLPGPPLKKRTSVRTPDHGRVRQPGSGLNPDSVGHVDLDPGSPVWFPRLNNLIFLYF